ncbi:MAG: hypothetical protein EAZ97_11020 [Bacteroidetes bacterium]|nr:MAG: hypothetical protein EAZ97_11020 [Bacteroidota bacterium]
MIDKYIKQILQEQQKVVIPTLGTFTAQLESADPQTLAPASRLVTFGEKTDSDATLKKAIMQAENLDDAGFAKKMAEYKDEVEAHIISFNEYKIEGLGVLTKNDNGQIIFKQIGEQTINSTNFGLPPIPQETKIVKEEIKKVVKETPAIEPSILTKLAHATEEAHKKAVKHETEKENLAKMQKKSSTNQTNTATNVEKIEKKKTSELVWWLVIIPLVFMLAFLGYLFAQKDNMSRFKAYFSKEQDIQPIQSVAQNQPASNAVDTTSQNVQQPAVAENTPVAEDKGKVEEITTPPANGKEDAASKGTWYVILGSFKDMPAAQKLQKQLEKEGIKAQIIPNEGQSFRVGVPSEDKATAESKKDEMSAKFSGSWVMKY